MWDTSTGPCPGHQAGHSAALLQCIGCTRAGCTTALSAFGRRIEYAEYQAVPALHGPQCIGGPSQGITCTEALRSQDPGSAVGHGITVGGGVCPTLRHGIGCKAVACRAQSHSYRAVSLNVNIHHQHKSMSVLAVCFSWGTKQTWLRSGTKALGARDGVAMARCECGWGTVQRRSRGGTKAVGERCITLLGRGTNAVGAGDRRGPGTGREENCSAGGGGGHGSPFSQPPPSLLGRRDGRGGFRAGAPDLPCRGGGGQPNIYGSK